MQRRTLTLSLALGGLVSLAAVGAVAGQEEGATEQPAVTVERTGKLKAVTNADGHVEYQLTDANGTIPLSVGPFWFWGDNHPLDGILGTLTVTGEPDDGTPPANASDADRADGVPSFDVFAVNGESVRAAGKPPWAGRPSAVGASHPGHAASTNAAP